MRTVETRDLQPGDVVNHAGLHRTVRAIEDARYGRRVHFTEDSPRGPFGLDTHSLDSTEWAVVAGPSEVLSPDHRHQLLTHLQRAAYTVCSWPLGGIVAGQEQGTVRGIALAIATLTGESPAKLVEEAYEAVAIEQEEYVAWATGAGRDRQEIHAARIVAVRARQMIDQLALQPS